MAGNKMLVSMALLVVGAAAHPAAQAVVGQSAYHAMLVSKGLPTPYPGYDPCAPQTTTPGTTVTTTPAPTVTVTKAEPCSTVTTTPGATVTTTPAPTVTVTKAQPCSTVTTTPGTTATTTPPGPICASFTCEVGYKEQHQGELCSGRVCTRKQCCEFDPCHPVNLKAVVPPPVVVKAPVVAASPCTTMAPVAPVAPVVVKAPVVAASPCTTIAPVAPVAPVVVKAPVVAANPCTTMAPVAPRLFDAKEKMLVKGVARSMPSKKVASAGPAWSLPFLGMVAMFSLFAFIAVRVRRTTRSTRHVHISEPVDLEDSDEALLGDDDIVME